MLELLWLVPALPLAGFAVLWFTGQRLAQRWVAVIGVGSVGLSFVAACLVSIGLLASHPSGISYSQTLWIWMDVADFRPAVSLYLDGLSVVMVMVVTFVAFAIQIYSVPFMANSEGFGRFFAYMNLFVASMLTLVLAKDLLLLYLGWEGVGLCSYLLIGFWYTDPANGYAAGKAFVTTRVGDTALIIGLFLVVTQLGTLDVPTVLQLAAQAWTPGSAVAVSAAALLLAGAVGKSAQLPLQVWLPDAMAGPTPVSALLHAATMVTAGVYLIARTSPLFLLAPQVMEAAAIIGTLTLLMAGTSALAQWDIKRVLAYSTMSQVGYMFLALGLGAWSAAIFHFVTHAFFKALLFLAAGVVIVALNEEHDIFKMGGLRKAMPLAFWAFLIGAGSLAGLPLITAGGYSKEAIIYAAWAGERGTFWLWLAGMVGAFITSVYAFRAVFLVFFGPAREASASRPERTRPPWGISVPLLLLGALSTTAGALVDLPIVGGQGWLSNLLQASLPPTPLRTTGPGTELAVNVVSGLLPLIGVALAYRLYARGVPSHSAGAARVTAAGGIHRLAFEGWGFDWLYGTFLVRPLVWVSRVNRPDITDSIYRGVAELSIGSHRLLRRTETGKVRWYAAAIALGAILLIAVGRVV